MVGLPAFQNILEIIQNCTNCFCQAESLSGKRKSRPNFCELCMYSLWVYIHHGLSGAIPTQFHTRTSTHQHDCGPTANPNPFGRSIGDRCVRSCDVTSPRWPRPGPLCGGRQCKVIIGHFPPFTNYLISPRPTRVPLLYWLFWTILLNSSSERKGSVQRSCCSCSEKICSHGSSLSPARSCNSPLSYNSVKLWKPQRCKHVKSSFRISTN